MDNKLISDFFLQKLTITAGNYDLTLHIYQIPVLVKEATKMIESDEIPTLDEICKRLGK